MPPFRIRDLMVDVVPSEARDLELYCGSPRTFILCGLAVTNPCRVLFSRDPCRYLLSRDPCRLLASYDPCRFVFSGDPCAGGMTIPPVSLECPYELTDVIRTTQVINAGAIQATPEELVTLKAQLQQALANIEAQERVAQEQLRPQTIEQVDLIEQQMTAALDELKVIREEIQKRQGQG